MKCLRETLKDCQVDNTDFEISTGDLICEIYLANLEHLLRCLQQVALAAILCLCVTWIVANFLQAWHLLLSQLAWFTEWPNGRHPLSTTWPWTVRPSLLVLWGVCWMFYYGDGPSKGSDQPFGGHPFGQDFRTRQDFTPHQELQPRHQRKTHSIHTLLRRFRKTNNLERAACHRCDRRLDQPRRCAAKFLMAASYPSRLAHEAR